MPAISPSQRVLDRLPSETDEHIRKFPLTARILEALPPRPMAIGVNWYSGFDVPRNARGQVFGTVDAVGPWWVGRDRDGRFTYQFGSLRGGHSVALKPRGVVDNDSWWYYYDQGVEGRCVQFGVSRMMTLYNRKRYEVRETQTLGRWLYYEAQKRDEWAGGEYPGASPVYSGTSVNAALKVVKGLGLVNYGNSVGPTLAEGISEYRWATDYNDVKSVLGYSDVGYVDVLNSWGQWGYPHLVRVPDQMMARLLDEDGEFGVVTDR